MVHPERGSSFRALRLCRNRRLTVILASFASQSNTSVGSSASSTLIPSAARTGLLCLTIAAALTTSMLSLSRDRGLGEHPTLPLSVTGLSIRDNGMVRRSFAEVIEPCRLTRPATQVISAQWDNPLVSDKPSSDQVQRTRCPKAHALERFAGVIPSASGVNRPRMKEHLFNPRPLSIHDALPEQAGGDRAPHRSSTLQPERCRSCAVGW